MPAAPLLLPVRAAAPYGGTPPAARGTGRGYREHLRRRSGKLPTGNTPRARATLTPEALDQHQDRLQQAHEASGAGWITTTRLRGRTYLRAGILNYLSTRQDMDGLLDDLRAAAAGL